MVFSESLYREYLIAFHLAQCINKGWDELVVLFDEQGSVRTPTVSDLLAHWTFQHESLLESSCYAWVCLTLKERGNFSNHWFLGVCIVPIEATIY